MKRLTVEEILTMLRDGPSRIADAVADALPDQLQVSQSTNEWSVFDNFEEISSARLPPEDQWEAPIEEFPLMYALQTAHHQELHRTQINSALGTIDALPAEKDSMDVWGLLEKELLHLTGNGDRRVW